MPGIYFSDDGLNNAIDQITPQVIYYHLYKNAFVPGPHFNPAFITESTYSGYAAQATSGWSSSVIDGGGHGSSNAALLTFTATGLTPGENAYGYYATLGPAGPVLWAEEFPLGPFDMSSSGKQVFIVPNLGSNTPLV